MADTTTDIIPEDQINDTEDVDIKETIKSRYKSIGERFAMYALVFTNTANDSAIQEELLKFNYTREKITQGESLLEDARQADAKNAKEYGEQYAAWQKVEKEYVEASNPYVDSLQVARIAFANDRNANNALMLKGRRPSKLAEWLHVTDVFYRNLLTTDAYLAKMAEFGRTKEILDAEYKEIKDVNDTYAAYKKEMGEALESTKIRDEKIEMLDNWMSDFIGIARIALKGNPEALKKLGL